MREARLSHSVQRDVQDHSHQRNPHVVHGDGRHHSLSVPCGGVTHVRRERERVRHDDENKKLMKARMNLRKNL